MCLLSGTKYFNYATLWMIYTAKTYANRNKCHFQMPFECIPLMFSKRRDCFCRRSALSAGITAPAIPFTDRMQQEKLFAHWNFLHFSYLSDLWLIVWKGFWVIKKEFLVWQANIWSYFSGLSLFLCMLLPSFSMSVHNKNANKNLKCFILA